MESINLRDLLDKILTEAPSRKKKKKKKKKKEKKIETIKYGYSFLDRENDADGISSDSGGE
jgi:hypothetical protein